MGGVTYRPDVHHRRSIRLPAYDYAQAGAYFVTICTHERELLFEDTGLRSVVYNGWSDLKKRFSFVRLDQFVIMPNHIHGIIWIRRPDVGAQLVANRQHTPLMEVIDRQNGIRLSDHAAPLHPAVVPRSLGAIVRSFKAVTAKRINRFRGTPGARQWQRDYYERIIRDEDELTRIRQYIRDNPAKWAEDKNNPLKLGQRHVDVGPSTRRGASTIGYRRSNPGPCRKRRVVPRPYSTASASHPAPVASCPITDC